MNPGAGHHQVHNWWYMTLMLDPESYYLLDPSLSVGHLTRSEEGKTNT